MTEAIITSCPQCGGKIESNDYREAVICEYCGNNIVLRHIDTMNSQPKGVTVLTTEYVDCYVEEKGIVFSGNLLSDVSVGDQLVLVNLYGDKISDVFVKNIMRFQLLLEKAEINETVELHMDIECKRKLAETGAFLIFGNGGSAFLINTITNVSLFAGKSYKLVGVVQNLPMSIGDQFTMVDSYGNRLADVLVKSIYSTDKITEFVQIAEMDDRVDLAIHSTKELQTIVWDEAAKKGSFSLLKK